ncbi:hypothetical protein Hanom_Chr02g00172421 [Helianthus anomalus]
MPTTSAGGESTSAKDTTISDTGGSSGNFTEYGARLFDDLYLPTVQRAYPPLKSAYVEGLDTEHLMNTTMVDVVSGPRRLAKIRRRWMHDNSELRQARMTIQELVDEKGHLERQLYAFGDDLKRVTANLAEERVIWDIDVAEKDHILSHAKAVQEELECKAINEARKVRSELSAEVESFRIDTDFFYQVQERYQDLTVELEASNAKAQAKQAHLKEMESALDQSNAEVDSLTSRLAGLQGDRNWLISQGLVGAFENLRESEPFIALLDRLSTAS